MDPNLYQELVREVAGLHRYIGIAQIDVAKMHTDHDERLRGWIDELREVRRQLQQTTMNIRSTYTDPLNEPH